jgi:hypothetical protein
MDIGDRLDVADFDLGDDVEEAADPVPRLVEVIAVEGADDVDEVVAPDPAPVGFQHRDRPQNSLGSVWKAQCGRVKKAAERRESCLRVKKDLVDRKLNLVKNTLPDAAHLLGERPRVITSRKDIKQHDFVPLCHCLHIPTKRRVKIGINQKRLVTMGCDVILIRQREGWRSVMSTCREARRDPITRP